MARSVLAAPPERAKALRRIASDLYGLSLDLSRLGEVQRRLPTVLRAIDRGPLSDDDLQMPGDIV